MEGRIEWFSGNYCSKL